VKKYLYTIVFTLLLVGFTAYMALDTFVLGRAYQSGAGSMNLEMFEQAAPSPLANAAQRAEQELTTTGPATEPARESDAPVETVIPEVETTVSSPESGFAEVDPAGGEIIGTYSDAHMQVTLVQYVRNDTAIYAADVQLTGAEYLKTAFAQDTYGKNITEKTSEMAAEHNAVLAINGDYYGTQESGYVIRNGIIYRDSAKKNTDVLCVYADGTLEVVDGESVTAQALLDSGVWQAFSFGPGLLADGEITVSETEEVGKAMASNPRTALGMISPLHYVFVVSDGRTDESEGLSLYQLAEFMQSLNVTTAYNLDGGGSSTMVFEGEVVNNPAGGKSANKERSVSDIVYIG